MRVRADTNTLLFIYTKTNAFYYYQQQKLSKLKTFASTVNTVMWFTRRTHNICSDNSFLVPYQFNYVCKLLNRAHMNLCCSGGSHKAGKTEKILAKPNVCCVNSSFRSLYFLCLLADTFRYTFTLDESTSHIVEYLHACLVLVYAIYYTSSALNLYWGEEGGTHFSPFIFFPTKYNLLK